MSILGSGLASYGAGLPGMGSSTSSGRSQTQQSTQIVPGMMGVYSDLLNRNQQNYGNVLSAYTKGQQTQASQLPGIYGGYNTLQGQVAQTMGMGAALGENGNWGVAQPAATAIGQSYQKALANNQQQMANSGLGNTTALGNAQNQAAMGAAQQYGALGANLAGQYANQQMQIGQAGLGAQMQGSQAQAQLAAQRGSSLAGYNFANTAGSLTGGFGSSSSQQTGESQQRGGLPGGGSNQANQLKQPNLNDTGGQSPFTGGGGGGGGYYGGVAGAPGYNPATAYANPGTDYGFTGAMNQTPNYLNQGMTNQNPGGYSVQDFSKIGTPTPDITGAMNQTPNYQQPGQSDENAGGFSAGAPASGLGGTYTDENGKTYRVGDDVPNKPPRGDLTPRYGHDDYGNTTIIGWGL